MTTLANTSGIYKITNSINGKCYIGSAVSLRNRIERHFWELSQGTHHSQHLQRAYNNHSKSVFTYETLLYCSKETLIFFEQRAIDAYKPEYNNAKIAGSNLGVKLTKEQIAKRSGENSCKYGIPVSDEIKQRISNTLKGRKIPKDVVDKVAALKRGKPLSKKHCENISKGRKGMIFSEEHKQHLSDAQKRVSPEIRNKVTEAAHSLEARAKMSARFKGIPLSEEHKAKLSAAKKGKKQTQEAIANRVASIKETNKRKREKMEAALLQTAPIKSDV